MSMGVDLAPTDVAYRCNIVTVRDEIMADFSAGHITSAEGAALFTSLTPHVPGVTVKAGSATAISLLSRTGQQPIRQHPMTSWASPSRVAPGTGMRRSFFPAWQRAATCSAITR